MRVSNRSAPDQPNLVRRGLLAGAASIAAGPVAAALPKTSERWRLSDDAKALIALRAELDAAIATIMSPEAEGWTDEQADALYNPIENQWEAVRRRICARPVKSWSDVIDRALLALRIDRENDGAWTAIRCAGMDDDTLMSECVLGVLIMAGVTDGQIERHGDPNYRPRSHEVPDVNIDPIPASFDGRQAESVTDLAAEFGGLAGLAAAMGCSQSQAKLYVSVNWLPEGWFRCAERALAARGKTLNPDLSV